MSTVTPNLGLVLPSNSEKVSRVIINTNNERIDAAFGTAGAKVYTVELAVSNVSGAYEGRVDDDVITAQMSANRLYIVDPTVFNDVITVTCYDGYLTLSCDDVAGDTTVEITVIKEAVDPTQITSTEFDILNNRIGDLSTLDTTNKSNVVNAVNEVKAGVDTNSDAIANVASALLTQLQGNSLILAGTLGGDVISKIKEAQNGITFYRNSNNPTNHPTGGEWGAYLIIRIDTIAAVIYFDNSHFACSYGINTSTATSISWNVIK